MPLVFLYLKIVVYFFNFFFVAIYTEYAKAKRVTQERMYLETMEKVLADIDKVIIDKNSGSGVVPYLPLPELKKKAN